VSVGLGQVVVEVPDETGPKPSKQVAFRHFFLISLLIDPRFSGEPTLAARLAFGSPQGK
jgi:hypothetical protein